MRVNRVLEGRGGYVLALLISLPAVWPLLGQGFITTDDGLFHLYRLAALDEAFHAGAIYPRWFPDFAYGYGHPVLNFYGPLSYYVGFVFHLLGAGYILSTKFAFALGYLLSGLFMYIYAREMLGNWGGILAAVAYVYFPYHLAETYVRGALAEQLAFVFLPLILWSLYRLFVHGGYHQGTSVPYLLLGGTAYASLILTHSLTALIFTPIVLAYVACLWLLTQQNRALLYVLVTFILAMGVIAFYWLPVVGESRWVGLAAGGSLDGYRHHLASLVDFISFHTTYHYSPPQSARALYSLNIVWVAFAVLSIAALCVLGRRMTRLTLVHLLFFQGLALLSSFMMLSYSLPLWRLSQPLLGFLQYPWRFMTLAGLALAFLIGSGALFGQRGKGGALPFVEIPYAGGLIIPILLVFNSLAGLPLKPFPLTDDEVTVARMWQGDFAARQIGATWTAEYVPLWVKADRSAIPLPLSNPSLVMQDAQVTKITLGKQGLLEKEFQIESKKRFPFRFHIFYFPGWQGYVDRKQVAVYPSGELGLVSMDIPPGHHQVSLRFEDTSLRRAAKIISLISTLGLVAALLWARQQSLSVVLRSSPLDILGWVQDKKGAVMGLIVCLAVPVVLLAWHIRPFQFMVEKPLPVEASLENKIELLGFAIDRQQYQSGAEITVTLYWLAWQRVDEDFKTFVHLTDESGGRLVGQHDGDPVHGFTPTTRWLEGELIEDVHRFIIPPETEPAQYRLWAGMYRFDTLRNLEAMTPKGPIPDGRIPLGEIDVRGP